MRIKTRLESIGIEPRLSAAIAEYNALRSEVEQYSERIDRITGIYIAALAAVLSYIVGPTAAIDIYKFLIEVQENPLKLSIIDIICIIHSILLLRLSSFYLAILSIAQYCEKSLAKEFRSLTKNKFSLSWDSAEPYDAKIRWIKSREISQTAFYLFAQCLSIGLLILSGGSVELNLNIHLITFLFSLLFFMLTLHGAYQVVLAGRYFHVAPY